MNQDLEPVLAAARRCRDIGNTILLVGILAEIAIEAFWPDWPEVIPVLRGKKSTTPLFEWRAHFWKSRTIAILLAGLVTFGGLLLERHQGTKADDVADQIRANLQSEVLSLNIQNTALTMMASGREAHLLYTPQLSALKRFAPIKALISNVVSLNKFEWSFRFGAPPPDIADVVNEEAQSFTGKLGDKLASRSVGWDIDACLRSCQSLTASDVLVFSKPLQSGQPSMETVPDLAKASPDEKAYMAGDSLAEYLLSVGIEARHWTFDNLPIDHGQLLILIGKPLNPMDPDMLANLEQTIASQMANSR